MKYSLLRGALILLLLSLFWLRSTLSWRPVQSIEAQAKFDAHEIPIASNGDWSVFQQENQRWDSTYLHIVNSKTKAQFDRTIAPRTDELYLGTVAIAEGGQSCFYSLAYTNTLGDPEKHYSYVWNKDSSAPLLLKKSLFSEGVFSRDAKTLYAISPKPSSIEVFDNHTAKPQQKIVLPPLLSLHTNPAYDGFFVTESGQEPELWRLGRNKGSVILDRLDLRTYLYKNITLPGCKATDFQLSTHSNLLLGTNGWGMVQMFDSSTGAQLWSRTLAGNSGACLSPDETLCMVAVGNQFNIYDAHTGRLLRELDFGSIGLTNFTFSSDSNRLLTAFSLPEGNGPQGLYYYSQRAR